MKWISSISVTCCSESVPGQRKDCILGRPQYNPHQQKNHTYTSDAGYSLNDGAISITCLKKQQPIADFCNPFQNQIFTLLKYQINLHPYAALQTENTLLLLLKSKGFGKEKPSALPTVGKRSLERKVHRLPLYPKDSLFTQRSPEEGH